MVLPGALLLPNSLLPLYIFEPRYKQMLAHALAHERMFCVALQKPQTTEDFFHVAGLGLIRACVARDDGTSHLILHGIARVKLARFVQETPFLIAQIHPLHSSAADNPENGALCTRALELCRLLKNKGLEIPAALDEKLPQFSSPELIADVLTQAVIQNPLERQRFLEELVVSERLRMLIRHLQQEL